jgi:hypothetical protein
MSGGATRWWSRLRQPVFILGTGRSGTNWIAEALASHPDVRATIEVQPMFRWATQMALDPRKKRRLLRRLVWAYRWQLLRSVPRQYLDKSHPDIWLAEDLQRAFPRAGFLGMEREPYATVASSLRHPGVSKWFARWREFPIPNRFLGIDEATAETYDSLPLAARGALRWKAHHERMQELATVLGDRFLLVNYEPFATNTAEELVRIQRFLGLRRPFALPPIKTASLSKWRGQLSDADIEAIRGVVGFGPPDAPAADPGR